MGFSASTEDDPLVDAPTLEGETAAAREEVENFIGKCIVNIETLNI